MRAAGVGVNLDSLRSQGSPDRRLSLWGDEFVELGEMHQDRPLQRPSLPEELLGPPAVVADTDFDAATHGDQIGQQRTEAISHYPDLPGAKFRRLHLGDGALDVPDGRIHVHRGV